MLKLFKKVDKKKSKDKKKKKGRPTCKKDEENESKSKYDNPKYKFINMQMEKLENMYVILTAEDGMSKYDRINCPILFQKILDSFHFSTTFSHFRIFS